MSSGGGSGAGGSGDGGKHFNIDPTKHTIGINASLRFVDGRGERTPHGAGEGRRGVAGPPHEVRERVRARERRRRRARERETESEEGHADMSRSALHEVRSLVWGQPPSAASSACETQRAIPLGSIRTIDFTSDKGVAGINKDPVAGTHRRAVKRPPQRAATTAPARSLPAPTALLIGDKELSSLTKDTLGGSSRPCRRSDFHTC